MRASIHTHAPLGIFGGVRVALRGVDASSCDVWYGYDVGVTDRRDPEQPIATYAYTFGATSPFDKPQEPCVSDGCSHHVSVKPLSCGHHTHVVVAVWIEWVQPPLL